MVWKSWFSTQRFTGAGPLRQTYFIRRDEPSRNLMPGVIPILLIRKKSGPR